MLHAAAGGDRLCALASDKTLWCYGVVMYDGQEWFIYDEYGNPVGGEWLQDSSMSVNAWPANLSVGASHDCYLETDGTAVCMGSNLYGALGGGSYAPDFTKTVVAGGYKFSAITAGEGFTCGLVNTAAYCWGYDGQGGLGLGYFDEPNVPAPVAGGLHFAQIDAGAHHTCGVTVDGIAYCWGDNRAGQLGNGTRNLSLGPVAVAGGVHFRSVVAGYAHSCGMSTDGTLYCWGWNRSGQLGDGSTSDALIPVKVARQP
jgi:alpha-tubulin suppressor-like RCC1 family protein